MRILTEWTSEDFDFYSNRILELWINYLEATANLDQKAGRFATAASLGQPESSAEARAIELARKAIAIKNYSKLGAIGNLSGDTAIIRDEILRAFTEKEQLLDGLSRDLDSMIEQGEEDIDRMMTMKKETPRLHRLIAKHFLFSGPMPKTLRDVEAAREGLASRFRRNIATLKAMRDAIVERDYDALRSMAGGIRGQAFPKELIGQVKHGKTAQIIGPYVRSRLDPEQRIKMGLPEHIKPKMANDAAFQTVWSFIHNMQLSAHRERVVRGTGLPGKSRRRPPESPEGWIKSPEDVSGRHERYLENTEASVCPICESGLCRCCPECKQPECRCDRDAIDRIKMFAEFVDEDNIQ